MSLRKSLLLLIALTSPVIHGNVVFQDCALNYEIQTVQIEGCDRQIPCYLTVGKLTNITVTYTAGFTSRSLVQEAHVMLNGVPREINISPQACEATDCPVKVQSSSLYQARFELPTNIALGVRGQLEWNIYSDINQKLICFRVTIQTQSMFTDFLRKIIT